MVHRLTCLRLIAACNAPSVQLALYANRNSGT